MAKAIKDMTAEELEQMAEKKKQEQMAEEKAKIEEKIAEAEQRQDEAKKHLNAIKEEIREHRKEIRKLMGSGERRKRGTVGPGSDRILEIVKERGKTSTKQIRETLKQSGESTENVGQTLAYLKRKGVLDSPERGTYEVIAEAGQAEA